MTLNNVSLSYQMVPGTLDPFPKFNGSDVASMLPPSFSAILRPIFLKESAC